MRHAVIAIAVVGFALGCGTEDVQLLRGDEARDGGMAEASPEAAVADGAGLEASGESDASSCPGDIGSRACLGNGASCAVDVECCSARCSDGTCLEAGSCAGPGAACTSRSNCCSGRCEPVAGTTILACLNYCAADGAACSRALDCCSMGCHGGTCGAPICAADESSCTSDPDCCSGSCSSQGLCDAGTSAGVCLGTGGSCGEADDGDAGDDSHCCGACDTVTGRCGFGPGPCLPGGALCTGNADCCTGTCAPDATGIPVCHEACVVDGSACTTGAQCCGGACTGFPTVCGAVSATACSLLGSACGSDVQCCTGQCIGGACGTTCSLP